MTFGPNVLQEVGIASVNSLASMAKEIEERNSKEGTEAEISDFEYSMIRILVRF